MKANDHPGEMGSMIYILPIAGVLLLVISIIGCLFNRKRTQSQQPHAGQHPNTSPIVPDSMTSSRIEVAIQPDNMSENFTRPPTKPAFKPVYGAISEAESG